MEAASTAFNKFLHKGDRREDAPGNSKGEEAATVHRETAPPVEHETIRKQHEQREQTVINKERHQDHYKTTVQPLKDREVMPEEHHYEQAGVQNRHFDHDHENDAREMLARKQGQFQDTTREAGTQKKTTKEPAMTSEHVHHHLHETIQPVIEKETVMPSVTHKTIPIKEVHKDRSIDEGTTVNAPISKEEFQGRLRK
ncbi:hypothetical protein HD806DRAFT_531683 [Xylariaceae sp. AK1471]|nr:hypothetical protein HD806DRAFT_531683 [Xylariaceae sp. AK1471]